MTQFVDEGRTIVVVLEFLWEKFVRKDFKIICPIELAKSLFEGRVI
jgi:hypothetical protein